MATQVGQAAETQTRLSGLEKVVLAVPMLAGLVIGLALLSAAQFFGRFVGYTAADADIFIYWLAGAGTLGYGVAQALALRAGGWTALRLPMAAVVTFNLCSLFACEEEIRLGRASDHFFVYLILAASVLLIVISGWLLLRHRGAPRPAPDTAKWLTYFLIFGAVGALATGLLALLVPEQFHPLFGLPAQDVFIYRQLGAATVGYGVMGILQVRSRRFGELRLSLIMGALFNALACLIGILALVTGKPPLLPITLVIVPFILATGCVLGLVRKGK